jgi:hypothetical protein
VFDGGVKGFQFYIRGVTITGVSGGSSNTYLDFVNYLNADCDSDGIADEGCTLIAGVSFGEGYIPANDQSELLLSATFTDFNGTEICFDGVGMEGEGNWSPPVISNSNGDAVPTDWGSCVIPGGTNYYYNEWLSINFISGTIPAASSQTIQTIFDPVGLNGGGYTTDIIITSNDPDESELIIPVTMMVTGIPNIGVVSLYDSTSLIVFNTSDAETNHSFNPIHQPLQ